jgi:hypothetical protein
MSTTITQLDSGRRFAAWAAILGALLVWAMLACYAVATGGDVDLLARPAAALAMTPAAQGWFLTSMLADIGIYLTFLVIGPYFWSQQRPTHGVSIDTATLCIACIVPLGLAGASMQVAALPALAQMHAAGDPMVRAASESAWLGVVTMTQAGLWWVEGPLWAFWGVVIGRAQLSTDARLGSLLIGIGLLYGVYFILTVVGLASLAQIIELFVIPVLSLWMLLTGVTLLRRRA